MRVLQGSAVLTHTLPNGLRVLIRVVPTLPVASCWLWYRVGSRHDPPALTGLAHFVEHLLFTSAADHRPMELKRLVARYGGICNGFTALDYTAWFATMPAHQCLPLVQIVADRLRPLHFDPAVVARTRAIIQAEHERAANRAQWWFTSALHAAAFHVHPYRQRVLGHTSHLPAISTSVLEQHYRTYYTPSNAVLVLVAAGSPDHLLQQVAQQCMDLPSSPPPSALGVVEPAQSAERRVILTHLRATAQVQIVYHVPACRHPDFVALLVLDAVLSGAKPISFSQGAVPRHSAWLPAALESTGRALHVNSRYCATADSWLFEVRATVPPNSTPTAVEVALLSELARIQQEGVTTTDLLRARHQLRAQWTYAQERAASQAWLLGMWEVLDTARRVETMLDEIYAVQQSDILRVARAYFVPARRTIGHLLATANHAP